MAGVLTDAVKEGAASARAQKKLDNRDPLTVIGVDPDKAAAQAAAQAAAGGPPNPYMEGELPAENQAEQSPEAIQRTILSQTDPVAMLREQSEAAEKEVSLKTLSKEQKDKILRAFVRARAVAQTHYEGVIEPEIINRLAIYHAEKDYYKKKFPKLSELCDWTSKDVQTTCEWILPGLLEAFTGSDDPLSVKGVNIEDDGVADKIQKLIRYELETKNKYYQFCTSELKNALAVNFAVAKVWWKREEKRTTREFMMDVNDSDSVVALMNGTSSGKFEIKSMDSLEEAPEFMKVVYDEVEIKSNHPVLEYVPNSELRYTPDDADIHKCKFVAHRKIVRGDYLKRREMEGIYENINKALEEYEGNTAPTSLDQDLDLERSEKANRPDDDDLASKEVELYEAYLKVDYNNDGIFEDLIVHAVGDNLIRVVENDFDFPPFFICCSVYDANAVFNKESFADMFVQNQDLKTALIRQIIINVSKNNSPRIFVDEQRTDMDALMANEEIIPIHGTPTETIFVPPSLPLSSISMDVVNYAQNEIEAQSGSTRYNQGLDSNSLNKTATGITAVLGASEKRNKMMARAIAENFFIPIYKFLIMLNQRYLEDEQMIRLTNESVSIRREELDIDYDLIVNVGQGAGTREAQIQYYMYVLNTIYPQLASQGIVNAKSWYNLVCKLLEQLGLRDVSQFLMDPESQEAQEAAAAAQQAAMEAQAQQMQNSIQLAIAKSSVPRVTIPIQEMPNNVIQQYLRDKLGIETTERDIAISKELNKE